MYPYTLGQFAQACGLDQSVAVSLYKEYLAVCRASLDVSVRQVSPAAVRGGVETRCLVSSDGLDGVSYGCEVGGVHNAGVDRIFGERVVECCGSCRVGCCGRASRCCFGSVGAKTALWDSDGGDVAGPAALLGGDGGECKSGSGNVCARDAEGERSVVECEGPAVSGTRGGGVGGGAEEAGREHGGEPGDAPVRGKHYLSNRRKKLRRRELRSRAVSGVDSASWRRESPVETEKECELRTSLQAKWMAENAVKTAKAQRELARIKREQEDGTAEKRYQVSSKFVQGQVDGVYAPLPMSRRMRGWAETVVSGSGSSSSGEKKSAWSGSGASAKTDLSVLEERLAESEKKRAASEKALSDALSKQRINAELAASKAKAEAQVELVKLKKSVGALLDEKQLEVAALRRELQAANGGRVSIFSRSS